MELRSALPSSHAPSSALELLEQSCKSFRGDAAATDQRVDIVASSQQSNNSEPREDIRVQASQRLLTSFTTSKSTLSTSAATSAHSKPISFMSRRKIQNRLRRRCKTSTSSRCCWLSTVGSVQLTMFGRQGRPSAAVLDAVRAIGAKRQLDQQQQQQQPKSSACSQKPAESSNRLQSDLNRQQKQPSDVIATLKSSRTDRKLTSHMVADILRDRVPDTVESSIQRQQQPQEPTKQAASAAVAATLASFPIKLLAASKLPSPFGINCGRLQDYESLSPVVGAKCLVPLTIKQECNCINWQRTGFVPCNCNAGGINSSIYRICNSMNLLRHTPVTAAASAAAVIPSFLLDCSLFI